MGSKSTGHDELTPNLSPEQRKSVALAEIELMELLGSSDDEIFFDGTNFTRELESDIILDQEATCEFLGIPVRKAFLMDRKDYRSITEKFAPIIEHYSKTKVGARRGFWDGLTFRYFNKANLGQRVYKDVQSQEYTVYAGEYAQGGQLRVFLPDCEHAQNHKLYLTTVVSFRINPDLKRVLAMKGFHIPSKGDK